MSKTEGESSEKKAVIILHQFPRTKKSINASPFPIKVETFLRMNKLEYTSDFKNPMGKKKKCPWITDDDGTPIADSQFIIEHLIKKHNLTKINSNPESEAIARAMRALFEDNLYFIVLAVNYVYGSVNMLMKIYPRFVPPAAPNFLQKMVIRRIKKMISGQAVAQGMGRHSKEEVYELGKASLAAISTFLGSKRYFLGSEPHPLDCTAFGFLAVLVFTFPEDHEFLKYIKEHQNLIDYVDRIKEEYYPDWDDLLAK